MASFFVASPVPGEGAPSVHDRDRCPPAAFPLERSEYLGEFDEVGQALAVARLRYPRACACACCAAMLRPSVEGRVLTALRS